MSPVSSVADIRSRFPVFRSKIYMNSCSQGALCDAVRAGFDAYLESWDREGSPWELWVDEYEAVRRLFAEFVGASSDEIAILPSASLGINSVASALPFRERPKVVMGAFEFPTMGHTWLAQRGRGAEIQFVEPEGDRLPAQRYAGAIDKRTAIVPITGVCFMNGWRSEVKQIVSYARAHGALVMLDDYQDCGTRPVDVKAMDLDFYVAGTLKYLLGPPGLAMMYVRKELISTLTPTIAGWFSQSNPFLFDVKTLDPSPTARRFEAGTPPIPNLYAAREGVKLLQSVGMENVARQVATLSARLINGARDLGIAIKTPPDSVGPLVVLRCRDSQELVKRMAARHIVVSNRHDGLRVSLHVYNTAADVDAVLEALAANRDLLVTGKHAMAQPIA